MGNAGIGANESPRRWFGVGSSSDPDPQAAATEAAGRALLNADPRLLIVFSSRSYEANAVLAAARTAAPDVPLIGCATDGSVGSRDDEPSVTVAALGGAFEIETVAAEGASRDLRTAGEILAGAAEPLTDSQHRVLLVIGDTTAGDQHDILRGAYGVLGASVPMVGGAAGPDIATDVSQVFYDGATMNDTVVAAAIGSDAPIGIGVRHGCRRVVGPLVVTRSAGHRVLELDDRPALDVYLEALDAEVPGVPEFQALSIRHPLALARRTGDDDARAVTTVDFEERSLGLQHTLAPGALTWILEVDDRSALAATSAACDDALAQLDGKPPLGMLAFDCLARRGVLGDEGIRRELALIDEQAPVAGFYTHGEIAGRGGGPGFHNHSVVVLALMIDGSRAEVGGHWSTQQLTEFLALVSSFDDESVAVARAIERAAEAVDAEVGAIVRNGQLLASIGFAKAAVPVGPILSAAWGHTDKLDVPGLGECSTISVSLEDDVPGQMLLARIGPSFERDEVTLLRAMARVLTLALQTLRVLGDERALHLRSQEQARENAQLLEILRGRQELLERLANIQRSIVRRGKLDDVLDAVVGGAYEFLDPFNAALYLTDPDNASKRLLAAARGELMIDGVRLGEETSEAAIASGDVVVSEREGRGTAMAAPVVENGRVVGALAAVATGEREWTGEERETLLAFAEHASLALTDARNFDAALHRSLHDLLTGLPNRALFLDRLDHATRRARNRRSAAGPAVLFLDLDGFKRVNDSLGHAAGDELLIEVANRLTGCLRPGDTASRFGGDEFAILLEDVSDPDVTAAIADRVMEAVQQPFRMGDKQLQINVSIGIAAPGEANEDLLRNADLAMYHAKGTGKGRYEVFDPQMHAALTERLRLESDLARAVEQDEFEVVYQPIVSLRTGSVVAVEALVRWQHPDRGLLTPDMFIPAAEDTGLIRAIGQSVLTKATTAAAAWQARHDGQTPLGLAVNLSVVQLENPGFVGEVARTIEHAGIDPHTLILEITETLLMHDSGGETLSRLKELGVQIAVDDFGTGYSSLQYLGRLPIDILKIARPFIEAVEAGESALAQAIIDVAQSLNLRVIAEGLEHSHQVSRLIDLGCQFGQGYHYARPLSADAVQSLLLAQGVAGWAADGPAAPHRRRARMIG